MDVVNPQKRSQMMSNIRSNSTKPEIELRRYLYHAGIRYRINFRKLPGHPDIVIRKYNAVIFVHGCFWHHHQVCKYAAIPKTRTDFWIEKFNKNINRDQIVEQLLVQQGWRVKIVWECELKNNRQKTFEDVLDWVKKIPSKDI